MGKGPAHLCLGQVSKEDAITGRLYSSAGKKEKKETKQNKTETILRFLFGFSLILLNCF